MRKGRLLAKSYENGGEPPPYALLTNHIRDVADAGDAILNAISVRSLANADLPDTFEKDRLERSARLGFWLHDLGKANEHFHRMLEGNREFVQLLRHEVISVILATREPIRAWLSQEDFDESSLYAALWAVAGHHRKFSGKTLKTETTSPAEIYTGHRDFHEILTEMKSRLGFSDAGLRKTLQILPPALKIGTGRGDPCDIAAPKVLKDLICDWKSWAEDYDEDGFDRFAAILKTITIAADVCASAFVRSEITEGNLSIGDFVVEALSAGLQPSDLDELMWRYVWERVDETMSHPELPNGFPPGFAFHEFQREVAELDSEKAPESLLTLAVAGCGSGKSLAAYLWGRRWCQAWADEGRTNFRLMFTLPTTGTATEHFKDYALACGVSPKLKGLSHSRSSVDLSFIAEETAPQEEGGTQSGKAEQAEAMLRAQADKIESLELWGTPLMIGTVDTVLGLMANARRPVYSFPAIMQSVIVFDEIHAYDSELFGHLLIFLETFPKIPILLMTASLQKDRREAIEKLRPDLRIIRGPEVHEMCRRYEAPLLLEDDESLWDQIRACLEDPSRGKVLWVRNQVDWAVRAYRSCLARLPNDSAFIGLYHSRFRYKDRVEVHAEVIKQFKKKGSPCILVATQVAEMSLDLSADLLVSDLAAIPAMIQRLGRLNRYATTDDGPSGKAIFCQPPIAVQTQRPNPRPYNDDDLTKARKWLADLQKKGARLSQRDLSDAFTPELDSGKAFDIDAARRKAVFISGLWETYPASTRGDGYTMPVILREDFENFPRDKFKDYRFRREWLREHEVSIPIKHEMRRWGVFGRTPIAPVNAVTYGHIDSEYPSERTGAAWTEHRSFIV